ncbi:MAG: recombinase family protein [Terriglobales bacterium]
MRAAIYSRFSTDKQTESSIADQVRVCREYAEKNELTVDHLFEDQGISGAAIGNRPGCVAMLEAAKARAFDVLLVMDTSRLSRSSADLSKIADRLVFMGLRIVAVHEQGADTARDGWELYFGLSGLMGQQFRKMTAKKTHTALESRARKGAPTGGRCFGYTSKNELVDIEAAVVREIFERYALGESYRAIARDLNGRGAPSPKGRKWYVSALHALIHNERYMGRLVWNQSRWMKDPDSGKRSRLERPPSEWITAEREDLRLVSDETWQRARARDTPATYGSHQARPKYPLSGLLLCAECRRTMTLCGGTNSRGYGSQRYICASYREHGAVGCSNSVGVSRLTAEEFLIEPLRERLLNDQKFLGVISALKKSRPKNGSLVLEPESARRHCDSGDRSHGGSDTAIPVTEGASADTDGHRPDVLAAQLEAIQAAAAIGALSQREAATRCATLRSEHAHVARLPAPTDEASILANAERLRAALVSAATDALRDALRRTLGVVHLKPVLDDGPRYLNAVLEGGDIALLEWLAIGDKASRPGLSALVAGARIETCLWAYSRGGSPKAL